MNISFLTLLLIIFYFYFQVVRQHEPDLIRAVNKLCNGLPDKETEEFLKGLNRPLEDETDLCRLFGTKFDAAYVNQVFLDERPGEAVTYHAQDEGHYFLSNFRLKYLPVCVFRVIFFVSSQFVN